MKHNTKLITVTFGCQSCRIDTSQVRCPNDTQSVESVHRATSFEIWVPSFSKVTTVCRQLTVVDRDNPADSLALFLGSDMDYANRL